MADLTGLKEGPGIFASDEFPGNAASGLWLRISFLNSDHPWAEVLKLYSRLQSETSEATTVLTMLYRVLIKLSMAMLPQTHLMPSK